MDFVQPHKDDRVLVRTGTDVRTEHMGTRSSYIYQLEEFITAVRGGAMTSPELEPLPDGVLETLRKVSTSTIATQLYKRGLRQP